MAELRRLLRYLLPYRWALGGALLCLALAKPAQLFPPLVARYIIDHVIGERRVELLTPAIVIMLVVYLLWMVLDSVRQHVVGAVTQRFVCDLRGQLYAKMQSHSLRFFHERRSGDLVSRVIGDVDQMQEVVSTIVETIIANSVQLVMVAAILLGLNLKLGALALLPMVGVALVVWRFNTLIRGLYRTIRDRLGDLSAKLQENLLGILVIKAFAREGDEQARFDAANAQYRAEAVRGVKARSRFFPTVFGIGMLTSPISIGYGTVLVLRGEMTTGDLFAFQGYWWTLFFPVFSLAQSNDVFQRAIAAASRIFELLDEPIEIEDAPDAVALRGVRGEIVFDRVRFGYDPGSIVLDGVDIEVRPGQMLGVVGPSGAGKSTLASLLMRLYDPLDGAIRLDGHDLRQLEQHSLRRHWGVVTQEPFLFNETVRHNVLYGRPEASEEEVIEAARRANAHEFILSLPKGYDTVVGERGVKLSGGQKQRLCIARAFLANPELLLLDEATAAVEPESEAIIQAALERLMQGRTSVVISHRMSMVRDSDQILVVHGGGIAERGTHDELVARGGWYARMYRLQMGVTSDAPAQAPA